jgi:8-oxo-dGTP pyrophosphatase MutT (NUDIX family)
MTSLSAAIADLPDRLLPLEESGSSEAPEANRAAVLILLYPRAGVIHFVLTVRPHTLSRHPGQVSLPGGRAEPEDASLWETAVRETEEELGIDRTAITPLGRLEDYRLRVSNYLISPFVGWANGPLSIVPDPVEVAEIIEVPLASLLDPQIIDEDVQTMRGRPWSIVFYRFGEHRVWGATAHILHGLARHLQSGHWAHLIPGSVRPVESP